MLKRVEQWRGWTGLILLWGFVSLACNLPAGQVRYVELERPVVETEGLENSAESTPETGSTTEPLAPISTAPTSSDATPTLIVNDNSLVFAPTVTPRGEPIETVEPPTPTPIPLTLDYVVEWRLNANDTNFSFAKVTLTATGGEPPYVFYRDGLAAGGANFSYRWGSCQENPGSFKVESADGQVAEVEYFENTPCPGG